MSEAKAAAQGDDDVGSDDGEELQFDQAEYTTPAPAGPICAGCKRPITDDYFEINGKIICPTCRQQIEASFRGGSRALRVINASLLGTVAAIAGAVLYYVIIRVTGLNIGLVSVLVGFMVGTSVRKGSGNRGGPFYQLLAVFLTYSAIAAMLVPLMLLPALTEAQQKDGPGGVAADPPPKALPNAKAPPLQTNQAPAEKAVADQKDDAKIELPADGARAKPADQPWEPGGVLFISVFVVGFFYTLPIWAGFHAPISGLIYGFALWEAWRINNAVPLDFNGPFRVNPDGPPVVNPEFVDDDE